MRIGSGTAANAAARSSRNLSVKLSEEAMKHLLAAVAATTLVGLVGALPAGATCGGGGGGGRGGMSPDRDVAERVYQVPWTVISPTDRLPDRGLVLYWFPASVEEIKKSSLRTSRDLSLYSAQCVGMEIADAAQAFGRKLDVGKVPVAVLTDAAGAVLGRVEGQAGFLRAPEVERLVREEI